MLVPQSDAGEFERLIDGSRKLIFEDTGHMAMIEHRKAKNAQIAAARAEAAKVRAAKTDAAAAQSPTGDHAKDERATAATAATVDSASATRRP